MFIAILAFVFAIISWIQNDLNGLLFAITGILLDVVCELSTLNSNVKVLVGNLNVHFRRLMDKIKGEG